jgi:ABC-type sugar transport system substrate-binding protein
VALVSAAAFANLCPADSASGDHKKVVGVTLVSFQSPYLMIVVDAMKVEAAKQGIDLVFLDSARSVATESSQVESLIARKVDLIVMNPVDQRTSQAAAKLINNAGIPLILLDAKFTDDFTFGGGKFVAYVGSEDTVAGAITDAIPLHVIEFRVGQNAGHTDNSVHRRAESRGS